MKRFLLFVFAAVSMTLAGIAQTADYKLNVQNFCELTVVDGINVDYICRPDSAGWAIFSCSPELASRIMFTNKAERLTIQTDADEEPIEGMPKVTVYSASLRKVENSGDSLLRVFSPTPVKNFKAKQIGNGSLEIHGVDATNVDAGITAGKGTLLIDGKAVKATISNVSTGPIDASGLDVPQLKCLIFGTGDVDYAPTDQLRIFGAGTGEVFYHSTPAIITNRSIGVKASAKPDKATEADPLMTEL